jgi:hypothetical protein
MEGESLLNDASSFTLFTIFLGKVQNVIQDPGATDSGTSVAGSVVGNALKLGLGAKKHAAVSLCGMGVRPVGCDSTYPTLGPTNHVFSVKACVSLTMCRPGVGGNC